MSIFVGNGSWFGRMKLVGETPAALFFCMLLAGVSDLTYKTQSF